MNYQKKESARSPTAVTKYLINKFTTLKGTI